MCDNVQFNLVNIIFNYNVYLKINIYNIIVAAATLRIGEENGLQS